MSITFASQEDRNQLKAVYQACFPDDPASFWDFELDRLMQPDNILVYREGDRILSTVQILSEELTLQGTTYPVQYIYAAATTASERNKGHMKNLIEMRLSKDSSVRAKTLILKGASSASMAQKTAAAIDAEILKMGIKSNNNIERQAQTERNSKLIFEVVFEE